MKWIFFPLLLSLAVSACITPQEKFSISHKLKGQWSKEMYSTEPDPMKNVIQDCAPGVGFMALVYKPTHIRIRYESGREKVFSCEEILKKHH